MYTRLIKLEHKPPSHLFYQWTNNGPQSGNPVLPLRNIWDALHYSTIGLMIGSMDLVNPAVNEPVRVAKL